MQKVYKLLSIILLLFISFSRLSAIEKKITLKSTDINSSIIKKNILFDSLPIASPYGLKDENPCVPNVEALFNRLETEGSELVLSSKFETMPQTRYTGSFLNFFGIDNHIQGILRLTATGYHFLISAGDPPFTIYAGFKGLVKVLRKRERSLSEVWIAEVTSLKSRRHTYLGLNNLDPSSLKQDRIIKAITIEQGSFWHSGSMSQLGYIVGIPLQTYKVVGLKGKNEKRKAKFLYLDDPKIPKRLDLEVKLERAANIGLVKLKRSKRFLLITSNTSLQYYIYISKTQNFLDGFTKYPLVATGINGAQGINLVQECKTDNLYVFTFTNDGAQTPVLNGRDNLGLMKLNGIEKKLLNTDINNPNYIEDFSVSFTTVSEKVFSCKSIVRSYCNFNGGASLYFNPYDTSKAYLYSIKHFLGHKQRLFMKEFRTKSIFE